MSNKKIVVMIIVFITIPFSLISIVTAISQPTLSLTATVAPFSMRSLFAEDSCAPPCWFGLIPDESTSTDVKQFVQSLDDNVFDRVILDPDSTFDPETGAVITGNYSIRWHLEIGEERIYPNITIRIVDSVVSRISAGTGRRILLTELLDSLGPPDYVAFERLVYGQFHFDLEYWEPRLSINLESLPIYYDCSVSNIWDTYLVSKIVYYPPLERYDFLPSARHVPQEIWQTWLDGKETANCYEAWETLQGQASLPLPTTTPEP